MDSIVRLKIWLKNGSMLKDWTLTQADIKIEGVPFDFGTFEKLDDAYLYITDGSKIYRDLVKGTVDVHIPGIAGSLRLAIEQIEEMVRTVT